MFKRLIKAIEFSKSSNQDVLSQSVVEMLQWKIPRGQQEELCNTLYDLMMGTIEKVQNVKLVLRITPNARAALVTLGWLCLLSVLFAYNN